MGLAGVSVAIAWQGVTFADPIPRPEFYQPGPSPAGDGAAAGQISVGTDDPADLDGVGGPSAAGSTVDVGKTRAPGISQSDDDNIPTTTSPTTTDPTSPGTGPTTTTISAASTTTTPGPTTTVGPNTTTTSSPTTTTTTVPTTTTTTSSPTTTTTTVPTTSTTVPTTTTTTVPTTTTTAPDAWTQATVNSAGGTVVYRWRTGEVDFVSAVPNPGFAAEVEDTGPDRVRVDFENDDDRVRVDIEWENGAVVVEIDD